MSAFHQNKPKSHKMPKKIKIRIKSYFEQKNALWGEFGENEGRTGEKNQSTLNDTYLYRNT